MEATGFIKLTTATGVEVPIRYGLSAIRRLCQHFDNCKLSELGDKITTSIDADLITTMELLVRVGAEAEAALNNEKLALNNEQLLSTLDAPGAFQEVMASFNASFASFSDPVADPTQKGSGKIKPSQKQGPSSGAK